MKVLVCDDHKRHGEQVRRRIEEKTGHDTEILSETGLKREIKGFFERVRSVLKGEPSTPVAEDAASAFTSNFDLAILDNNLSTLEFDGARQTAESIAGYLRAFGNIPYIVSLNKNPHVDFDLRYLVGDYQTQADLAVNDEHLSNPALWTGDPKDASDDGFLPWYWPSLNDAVERRRQQIRFVEGHLDEPIVESLGFPSFASNYLSRHARGELSPDAASATRITFSRFFVDSCRSLPIRKERKQLAARHGAAALGVMSRVVAGELDRWFRRDLLASQDLLVDLPHLLMRMPFLLGSHANDVQRWNEVVTATEPPYGLSAELYETHLAGARFAHDAWIKPPGFWWKELKSNSELTQRFFRDDSPWAEVVFCEDRSLFTPIESEGHQGPWEFSAEFEGAWNRRHVARLKGKHYTPRSRLAR